jgi:hypothetical protein
MTCTRCDRPARARGLCPTHYDRARHRGEITTRPIRRRADVLPDVELIIDTDTPANIAHRLGYCSPESLGRVLYRWGRPDLGRLFFRAQAVA